MPLAECVKCPGVGAGAPRAMRREVRKERSAWHTLPLSPHPPLLKPRQSRQIASTDREIDRLVYELYGLTEEEIRIVEGTTQ